MFRAQCILCTRGAHCYYLVYVRQVNLSPRTFSNRPCNFRTGQNIFYTVFFSFFIIISHYILTIRTYPKERDPERTGNRSPTCDAAVSAASETHVENVKRETYIILWRSDGQVHNNNNKPKQKRLMRFRWNSTMMCSPVK